MSDWTIPTRAGELEEQAAAWLATLYSDGRPRGAHGQFITPAPITADGTGPRESCPGCGRRVYTFELVDARAVPEHPGDYACGACRGALERRGMVSRAEWVERYGAPPDAVAFLRGFEKGG